MLSLNIKDTQPALLYYDLFFEFKDTIWELPEDIRLIANHVFQMTIEGGIWGNTLEAEKFVRHRVCHGDKGKGFRQW